MDLTLAGGLLVNMLERGELGASGTAVRDGRCRTMGVGVLAAPLASSAFLSAALRVAERRPAGKDDFGLEMLCGTLPDVAGLLLSSDGRGLGPSLTLGLVYCE